MGISMRIVSILGFAASVACFTAGCATSSRGPQQVQEVEPGTYSIGINRSSKTLLSSTDKGTIGEAVDKAGEYCHSKGRNLQSRRPPAITSFSRAFLRPYTLNELDRRLQPTKSPGGPTEKGADRSRRPRLIIKVL